MHSLVSTMASFQRARPCWILVALLLLVLVGSASEACAQDANAGTQQATSSSADKASTPSQQDISPADSTSSKQAAPPDEPYRPPEAVAVRSLVVPGWGQQVNGQSGKGWFLTCMAVAGVLLGTETIQLGVLTGGRTQNNLERDLGWFMYGGAVVWATIDGYLVAQQLNRENGYDLVHWPGPSPSPSVQLTLLRLGF